MKTVISILLAVFCFACSDDTEQDPAAKDSAVPLPPLVTPDTPQSFQLQVFDSIPPAIDGCGDYYSIDTAKARKGNYIFLSNMTEFALLNIEGKIIHLQKNKTLSKEVSPSEFISVFEGNGYTATLQAKIAEQYDEGGFYKGTLQIRKGDESVILKVNGETGC